MLFTVDLTSMPGLQRARPAMLSAIVMATGLSLLVACDVEKQQAGAKRQVLKNPPLVLFDGETLTGWEGNPEMFRVEDGAIVAGKLDGNIPHNYFLCTEASFGDFELTLKFKLPDSDINAGVQVRSQRVPHSTEVSGYQADIGQIFWGNLYDECDAIAS